MNPAWGVGSTDCDLSILPTVDITPRLPDHNEAVLRLAAMGVLSDGRLQEVLLEAPRMVHALPQPLGDEVNLEGSALKLPFWHDIDARSPLIPGHYETIQVLQLLQVRAGDRCCIIGPRGGWWVELLIRLGASDVLVIEPDIERFSVLTKRWNERNMDELAENFGCRVTWGGLTELAELACYHEDERWDRFLFTSALPRLPVEILRKLTEDGIGVVVVGEDELPILQVVTADVRGELTAQWIICWSCDQFEPIVSEVISGMEAPKDIDVLVCVDEMWVQRAWMHANSDPMRDRFAPEKVLRLIEEIWDTTQPFHPVGEEICEIRQRMSGDVYRMGAVLQNLGVIGLASEHQGESFRLLPSAEAASRLALALAQTGDLQGSMAWSRLAIETDPTLLDAWSQVGANLIAEGAHKESVKWLRAATSAPRGDNPARPWLSLARVHEKLGNRMAAWSAAHQCLEYSPEDEDALRIYEEFVDGLV